MKQQGQPQPGCSIPLCCEITTSRWSGSPSVASSVVALLEIMMIFSLQLWTSENTDNEDQDQGQDQGQD